MVIRTLSHHDLIAFRVASATARCTCKKSFVSFWRISTDCFRDFLMRPTRFEAVEHRVSDESTSRTRSTITYHIAEFEGLPVARWFS